VRTDHAEFARYLSTQFPPRVDAPAGPADVFVAVRWRERPEQSLEPRDVFPDWPREPRVDRHIEMGPGRVAWTRVDDAPAVAVASERRPGLRRFELRYLFSLGAEGIGARLKRLIRRRRLDGLRRARMSTLTYYAVYYPAWWHLEAQGAAHPLHAGGVALHGQGLLLAGLPGAGKSTVAAAFLGVAGAELLSDNVVLHDDTQLFGCFEPLLLDAGARRALGEVPGLRPLGRRHVFARDAFTAPHRTAGVPLAAAVLLARGPETRLVRLGARELARMLLAINEAAKEVRRYHVFASILGLVEPDGLAQVAERAARLERLLARVPCFRLEMAEDRPADAVAALAALVTPAKEVAR
jgi:hypothetical protein